MNNTNTNGAATLQVANTILEQLGGRRFQMMTGAKNFVGMADALMFAIPTAKGGINKIKITLTAADDYIVEGFKISRRSAAFAALAHVEGVYCDQLQAVFESMTGLYTRL